MLVKGPQGSDGHGWDYNQTRFSLNLYTSEKFTEMGLYSHFRVVMLNSSYNRQTSNIRRASVGNKIVDHSDVVGASPVGAAPTTSSFPFLTLGFNGLDKDNCKTRRETFTFWDLVWLILEVWLRDGKFFGSAAGWIDISTSVTTIFRLKFPGWYTLPGVIPLPIYCYLVEYTLHV